MKRTASIFNYYSPGSSSLGYGNNLIIRPPQNLKVFRATFFIDNRENEVKGGGAQISNAELLTVQDGIYISNDYITGTTNNVIPTANTGNIVTNVNKIVFDRRNEGYMADDFFVHNVAGLSVIWEGIIEE